MDVEDELRRLEDEFGFGVKHIGTSRWNDALAVGVAGEKAYIAVTTLEGTHLSVLLSVRGFQVIGEHTDDATLTEAQLLELEQQHHHVRGQDDRARCYETMQALLMAESPLYRQTFHERLLSRLSAAFPS